jgi:dihydroorotate dehydrogenase
MAAGFDKHGEVIDPLFNLGFGYVEIGSITPLPQPGNPTPRFFRLPQDDAVINRYGFNSVGHLTVLSDLKARFANLLSKNPHATNNAFRENKMLAINLGKNKTGDEIEDYTKGVQNFGPYADALVINVSSPNTPGLRDLQNEAKLTNLLTHVVKERNSLSGELIDPSRKPPILVKIAPDLTEPEIKSIAQSAKDAKIDGIILSNTTIQRPVDNMITKGSIVTETGGLSGKPLKPIALKAFRTLRKYTKDSELVLVGCGGISTGQDALEFARAGATYVELYTAFAFKGPGLARKIKDEITAELKKEGKTWMQIVGSDDK